jgi:DNA-3-methyladenine glycosylase I
LDYNPKEFQTAFDDLIIKKVALITKMQNPGIILMLESSAINLKVRAATNALAFLKIQEEFGSFFKLYWKY